MILKPGARLRSAVCDTQAVVVRPPRGEESVTCGGAAMLPVDQAVDQERDPAATPAAGADGGSLLGKRYSDEETGLEMLCTKAGAGALAIGGRLLVIREAKRLPSSD